VASTDDEIEQPSRAPRQPNPRRFLLILAIVVVIVLAAGITAAVASSGSNGSTRVHTNAAADVTSTTVAPTTTAPTTTAPPSTTTPTTAVTSPTTEPRTVATTPVGAPLTTTTPTTEMKASPISVLTWSATPASLTIATGKSATVTVAAHNGSGGVVSLPHPLSCPPRLQHDEVCEQMVQQVMPGTTATARYTIDAAGVAPGNYALNVEGVFTINVTVTTA
jgi:cytoskeletal protein RodZ